MTVEQTIELEARVPPEMAGRRADQAAAALFADYSRAVLKTWIESGELRIDAKHVKPKLKLLGGEVMTLNARLESRQDWQTAQSVPFAVVYEDDDLLVINKPAGVVVHPGAGNRDHTLVNGLLAHREGLALLPRAGIVHRLDKDTSGLLLVAATLPAHQALVKQLAQRTVSRRYLALTEGVLITGRDINLPIGRHPHQRTRQAVRDDGRDALTRIRVAQRFRAHTLIEAELETGRTHQIRVHLAAIGYPLLGDHRYGARGKLPQDPDPALVACARAFSRQALHAQALGFEHPARGDHLAFEAPPPADFTALVECLQADAQRSNEH